MRKFVISLEKDSLRRELFFKQDNTGDFSVFSAFNALKSTHSELSSLFDIRLFKKYYGRDVTSGEIGCCLSHINLYKEIYNNSDISNEDFILICEDDALFSECFFEVLNSINNRVLDTDILILGQSKVDFSSSKELELRAPISCKFLSRKVGYKNFIYGYPSHYSYEGTVCYLIKKSAIAKILMSLNGLPYWVADDFSLFVEKFDIKVKLLRPIIAIENPILESNLELARAMKFSNKVIYFKNARSFIKYPIKKVIAILKNILK